MFYILSETYAPNAAVTNHALSFVRGFSELGVKAKWVFLLTGGKNQRVEQAFPGIEIQYLWTPFWSKNKYIKHLYKHFAYAKFFFSLKPGDTVLLLGMSAYISRLTKRKGIKVYHERTEHPDAYKGAISGLTLQKYFMCCRKLDGFFVISEALRKYFVANGVPLDRVHVINMVVDSKRFEGIAKNVNSLPNIAYCGNASNDKDGVDILIKSFAIVAKQHSELKLKIIGPAPKPGTENIQLVESLGLQNNIEFTGIVPAASMPQLLVDAKMVALARPNSLQNKYGFPTKLGEYLLSGNPVIVTRVGDIPLFLKDGETGRLAYYFDIVNIILYPLILSSFWKNKPESRHWVYIMILIIILPDIRALFEFFGGDNVWAKSYSNYNTFLGLP